MRSEAESVNDYISRLPEERKEAISKLRDVISKISRINVFDDFRRFFTMFAGSRNDSNTVFKKLWKSYRQAFEKSLKQNRVQLISN